MASYQMIDNKIILQLRENVCATEAEVLDSDLFKGVVTAAFHKLVKRNSILLDVFGKRTVGADEIKVFIETLKALVKMPAAQARCSSDGAEVLLRNPLLLNDLIEYLYNFWRSFDRFIITDQKLSQDQDTKPYRTFNLTIGHLTNLVRGMYRDIQENVTGQHPRIYRQVAAGGEVSTIAVKYGVPLPAEYAELNKVPMIRQILLYPPLILQPPMNKRTGRIEPVLESPLKGLTFNPQEWLCYPAKVGELVILVYFHNAFTELGHSLANLFEMASDEDLKRKPDAVYAYGVAEEALARFNQGQVFFDDRKNDLLAAAIPLKPEYGYFGYVKKMILTLHNVIMMKRGRLPFHGAMVRIILKGDIDRNILFIGDTGAGKSETLEALRGLGEDVIQDLIIIADDMGSINLGFNGDILGYGTEIGAFLRLDDLQPGYALGQIDRAIIMSANQVNARIIIPVTTFDNVVKGHKVDFVLYANNYDGIDDDHPIIERFKSADQAMSVFREGTAMSKGTTTTTGLVHSYYANVFGPAQFRELHEPLARRYFEAFFSRNVFVGQMRSRLGLAGWEQKGPQEAARELLRVIQSNG
ncbi:MAG: phosphoenolpyruvate carboxykinase [Candidatus Omnitrophica bacterium]|nr:phosphoenolpyruvate carboxykinase [Candidatus Omnitrophota bacterium]